MSNYLISNGDVLDCTGGKIKKNTSVFIEGNRIAKIGESAKVKKHAEGKTYKTIDADGKTIMPGMIDCHVHPSYGEVVSIEELELYTPVEYRTLKAALNIKKILRAGVTSVCAPGGTFNINVGAARCDQLRPDRGAASLGGQSLPDDPQRHRRRFLPKPYRTPRLLAVPPRQHQGRDDRLCPQGDQRRL